MTDDALERRLRDLLAARADRAAIPASPAFRTRVLSVVDRRDGGRLARWPFERIAGALVLGLAGTLVLVFLVRPTVTRPPSVPGGVGAAVPPGISPGSGLTAAGPTLGFALLLVAVVGILIGVARLLDKRRVSRAVGGAVIVGLVVIALLLGRMTTSVGVSDNGSWAPGLGWIDRQSNDSQRGVFAPGPRGTISFALIVQNDGPIPVSIVGLAPPEPGERSLALVGLGRPDPPGTAWTGSFVADPTATWPFEAVTLGPGEATAVTVLGIAGDCAVNKDVPAGGYIDLEDIPLVVEVLGYRWVDHMSLTDPVAIAAGTSCPRTSPIPFP